MSRPGIQTALNFGWFVVSHPEEGIFVIEEPGHVQSYLVCGKERAVHIDTGMGFGNILQVISALTDLPVTAVNTHWHFDHIGGNQGHGRIGASEKDAPWIATPLPPEFLKALYLDSCLAIGLPLPSGFDPDLYEIRSQEPDLLFVDGDEIDLGGRSLTVLETPGHTRGSLSFVDKRSRALFCGDLVYEGTLYAHFIDSDLRAYQDSLDRLIKIAPGVICPGHNRTCLSSQVLSRALGLVTRVLEGKSRPVRNLEWGAPLDCHQWEGLGALVRPPGSAGVDLLAGLSRKDGPGLARSSQDPEDRV